MSARTCADCGHRLDIHTPDGCVALHLDGSLCACPTPTPERPVSGETTYPCDDCGTMRTKAEGGTTFTVCDACWDRLYRKSPTPPARERGEATPAPASGEEAKVCDLCDTPLTPKDWPNGYRTWYCATCSIPGELRPRLRAAKAEVARLTRELAEARAELVKTQELLGISVSRTTAARAEAARLREALAQNAELLDGVMAAGAFNRGRLWEHIREVAMQMRRALGQEGA